MKAGSIWHSGLHMDLKVKLPSSQQVDAFLHFAAGVRSKLISTVDTLKIYSQLPSFRRDRGVAPILDQNVIFNESH